MNEQTPSAEEPDRYARARSDEEPGAHSGGESQARDRVVRGTASAAEGYSTQGGTAQGDPPAGVEKPAQEGEAPGPVTRQHVRELLEARDDGPTLVVVEGRAQVVSADDLRSDRYAGALEVASGEELTRRATPSPDSEGELDALAATLNTMVAKLGA
ncbi:hypothetical protein ACFYO5_22575 [Streptomyces sp. NPDC006259]|uniref:hypothetical protein n=1 Tax=Streptomyces sp. NPDC006259 TaxID=3364740 RepID=UPI003684DFDD